MLAIVSAFALAALASWSIRLVVEVNSLRADLEERVHWLLSVGAARSALEDGKALSAEDWDKHAPQLDTIAAGMAATADTSGLDASAAAALSAVARQRLDDDDPIARAAGRAELERVTRAIRGQTATISADLGERWDSINLLVAISLFFATSTLGLLVYARSVTLRRSQDEVAMLQARLRTSDRLAAVGTLAAGVAHEINNPLTYVTTNLQLLREELLATLDPAAIQEFAPLIDDAIGGAVRVGGIVRQLESFGRTPHEIEDSANAQATVERALQTVAALDPAVTVRRQFDPTARVRGDETFLQEVFVCLIDNARRAMEDTTGRAHELRLRTATDPDGMVRITIGDTGCGIPPHIRQRVLEPFVTTRPVGQGTGLGLFVSHGVVTVLGGRLEIDSTAQGTTVAVVLPAA